MHIYLHVILHYLFNFSFSNGIVFIAVICTFSSMKHFHLCRLSHLMEVNMKPDACTQRDLDPHHGSQKGRRIPLEKRAVLAAKFILCCIVPSVMEIEVVESVLCYFWSGNSVSWSMLDKQCCQAPSVVKLEKTDKANLHHSTDISQQCSYLLPARISPKAGLSRETGLKWMGNSKKDFHQKQNVVPLTLILCLIFITVVVVWATCMVGCLGT